MLDPDYDSIVPRIQQVYSSCSIAEQTMLHKILTELAANGYSYTYEQIYLSDFKEVPVSIDQFLDDSYYLGETNNNGKNVYPFWRKTFNDIFSRGNKYYEILFSGSTRIGKSSSAVTLMAYMLYRLMLYRDPHGYFLKKPVSKFTLGFANLTKELALSVAYREFNDTLKESKWFMDHGSVTRSDRNFYYLPEGDKIEIIPASDGSQLLGKQLWCCLIGSTCIVTIDGVKRIDCCDSIQTVAQLIGHSIVYTEAQVKLIGYTQETVKLELSDDTVIEGTVDHKLMLLDGSYKRLDEFNDTDQLMSLRYDKLSEPLNIKLIKFVKHDKAIPVYDVVNVEPNHNFLISGKHYDIVSSNCCIDEANFAKSGVKDISLAKQHMKNLYDTVNARISGTFSLNGEVYGKMVTASSKNQDNDYLSEHIEKQLKAGNEHLYIVDEPQWKVLPKEMFSDKVFHFTVGDRYKRGFVIPEADDDEAHRKEYESQGYQVIEAPAELRTRFLADYDIALRDIAGISVAGSMGFVTQSDITPCVAQERQNPFFEDILIIGVDDTFEISDFFHADVVPNELRVQQMNIHIDFAESHNRTGIVGSCVTGNKIIENAEGKKAALPFIKEVFSVAIEAPRGHKQSYQKVVNFMIYLRQHYFNLGTITTDSFQSSFVRETLNQQGFETNKFSVDMDQFITLRNLLIDQRIELTRNEQQEAELISVQRVNNKIFIPEDEGGGHGDIATALAGSVYSLVSEQVTVRPPASHIAGIIAAVNLGRRNNPMSSAYTLSTSTDSNKKFPTRFPKLH